jgi:hypothetical protein
MCARKCAVERRKLWEIVILRDILHDVYNAISEKYSFPSKKLSTLERMSAWSNVIA